jgi:hypothetical protein
MDHLLGGAEKDWVVRFVLIDEDKAAEDGTLGEVTVPLASVGLGRTLHTTFEIGPCQGSGSRDGELGELEVILVWDLYQDAAARMASKQDEKEKAEARKAKEEQRRKKEQQKKRKKEEDEDRKEEARRAQEDKGRWEGAEKAARNRGQEKEADQTKEAKKMAKEQGKVRARPLSLNCLSAESRAVASFVACPESPPLYRATVPNLPLPAGG